MQALKVRTAPIPTRHTLPAPRPALAIVPPAAPAQGEPPITSADANLQVPLWIWRAVGAGFGAFLIAMSAAFGGDGEARFMIVVSALYGLMYFTTGALLFNVRHVQAAPCSGPLQTASGPLDSRDVAAQIVTIPLVVGAFGIGIAVIVAKM